MSPTPTFVVRGGSWYSDRANFVWSGHRSWGLGTKTSDILGFRACLLVRRPL